MKKNILLVFAASLLLSLATHSQLITISAEGTKQGKFKGESSRSKFTDRAEIAGYLQEVTSPRDAASGMASGKRTHLPLMVLKQSGASSPQFFQALTNGEVLKTVTIDFYKIDGGSTELNYYTVTLTNATVSGYKQFIGPLENEKFNPANNILYDEIKFTFQKIMIEDKISKTMTVDDWTQK